MAALLAGQGVNVTARDYRLPKATVQRWKVEARAAAGRSDDIGALLMGYLKSGLATLREQHVTMRDPAYLRTQSAGDLAVLHGVLMDKVIRLLEALEPPRPAAAVTVP
jgi:hypothetical protein